MRLKAVLFLGVSILASCSGATREPDAQVRSLAATRVGMSELALLAEMGPPETTAMVGSEKIMRWQLWESSSASNGVGVFPSVWVGSGGSGVGLTVGASGYDYGPSGDCDLVYRLGLGRNDAQNDVGDEKRYFVRSFTLQGQGC